MPNYREQSLTGSTWLRAYRVTCNNGHDRRSIWYDEERVIIGPEQQRITATSFGMGCGTELTSENAAAEFPMLDANGNPTGQHMTYADVYLVHLSLYYHIAKLRDDAEAAGNV